jgi:hypothetical protein
VTEERQETTFCESGEGDGGHIDADKLRGGKDSAKVIVDNVDGGEVRMGGDNRMKQSVDSAEFSCVGAYIVLYVYLVFTYRPSHPPLPHIMNLIPRLLHHPL